MMPKMSTDVRGEKLDVNQLCRNTFFQMKNILSSTLSKLIFLSNYLMLVKQKYKYSTLREFVSLRYPHLIMKNQCNLESARKSGSPEWFHQIAQMSTIFQYHMQVNTDMLCNLGSHLSRPQHYSQMFPQYYFRKWNHNTQ